MLKKIRGSLRGRVGPVGASLAAAALTAVAFAAVSVAKDDGGGGKAAGDVMAGPGPHVFQQQLSEEDKQALEEFRQCMSDQGVEGPPAPGELEQGERPPAPPEPPSKAERAEMEKAFKACEDKLPEGARGIIGPHPCGPPPGIPGGEGAAIPPPPGSGSREDTSAPAVGATS